MLKFTNSGLSRYQVSQSRIQATGESARIRILSFVSPLILGCVGLEMEFIKINTVLAALLGLVFVIVYGLFVRTLKNVKALVRNEQQPVTATREGMLKILHVGDLVVGDLIVLKAGEILPVDVSFEKSVPLMVLGKGTTTAQVGYAGMRVAKDALATVQAIGDDRQIVKEFCVGGGVISLKALLAMFVSDVSTMLKSGLNEIKVALQRLQNIGANTVRRVSVDLSAFRARLLDASWLRIRSQEAAFRYNQGPVS